MGYVRVENGELAVGWVVFAGNTVTRREEYINNFGTEASARDYAQRIADVLGVEVR